MSHTTSVLAASAAGSEQPAHSLTRRDFSARMVLLGAGTLVSSLPFSPQALAEVALRWGQVPPIDTGRDEALGNYPAYAEAIPCATIPVYAAALAAQDDAQFC